MARQEMPGRQGHGEVVYILLVFFAALKTVFSEAFWRTSVHFRNNS